MGWGEKHSPGAGTTGQIEEAHRALDLVGVPGGPLALRVLAAVGSGAIKLPEVPDLPPGAYC